MRNCISLRACFRLLSCIALMGAVFLLATPHSVMASEKPSYSNTFDRIIKGQVNDAGTGLPLSGASLAVKGTKNSALTDAQGGFSISVPGDNAVLVVSFVGYVSQEVVVGNRSAINFSLQSASADLAQVVVVGYGTQRKRDVTGAVKSVGAEEFNKGIINAPQQLLQGKVAGVNVTSASGEPGAAHLH